MTLILHKLFRGADVNYKEFFVVSKLSTNYHFFLILINCQKKKKKKYIYMHTHKTYYKALFQIPIVWQHFQCLHGFYIWYVRFFVVLYNKYLKKYRASSTWNSFIHLYLFKRKLSHIDSLKIF